ncbi:MAG: hypothetical protein DI565_05205 [Ancylobacter novellus]|uniref:Uncharacterized protein n=1 Tax=Ancylobacter novellus TaxID=921 RepID=A0A2W5KM34_ANCNO|nr:MAG: hypothetical protein DI565_05205 [Ancylobacter novellus]
MTRHAAALTALEEAARQAGAVETARREEFAREIFRLETERRQAYRRLSFLSALVAADAGAPDREASRAAQRDAAADELEWDEIDASRAVALDALEPLADAVHDERVLEAAERADEGGDRAAGLLLALSAFEARFEQARGGATLAQAFDRHMPETPLVDF